MFVLVLLLLFLIALMTLGLSTFGGVLGNRFGLVTLITFGYFILITFGLVTFHWAFWAFWVCTSCLAPAWGGFADASVERLAAMPTLATVASAMAAERFNMGETPWVSVGPSAILSMRPRGRFMELFRACNVPQCRKRHYLDT